ncbi:MAG: ABC transporter ATP-binding protein [Myxococcales bacterium]|nr:ABC transporter ATP-binding protein [Myxococcales bacterium]
MGLLGPNGAGKTTTVEILEGLTEPDAGVVEVLGQRWGAGDDRRLRGRIGVALQETRLSEKLTVYETVRLFRSFYGSGRHPDEVIEVLGLEEKRGAKVGKLSGGQRQRVALACALVSDPDVLFLDEPTTGLDPQARLRIWEVVEQYRAGGGTVLLTTHYMEEAARLCDRVTIIDHGRVIAVDSPERLVKSLGAEQIIEAELAEPAALELASIESLAGVSGASFDSETRRLTLRVVDIAQTLARVLAELERQKLVAETLRTHEATLEDVFVHHTGRGLRDG